MKDDNQHLQALESLHYKMQLLYDNVTAVAKGYSTGLYVHGTGGIGKSYGVYKHLEELKVNFVPYNSRMTAAGLFRALCENPDAIFVLEDMERLVLDKDAQGVLRSALWSQGDRERVVSWVTVNGQQRFSFRGGIIMMSNVPLADMPELKALASRIKVFRFEVSPQELEAQLRFIAEQGWHRGPHKLPPDEAHLVCEHVIAIARKSSCPLDFRIYDQACLAYLQWQAGDSTCHWMELVSSHIQQTATSYYAEMKALSSKEQQVLERRLVREILMETDDPKEQVALWTEKTGKKKTQFYLRKREVGLE